MGNKEWHNACKKDPCPICKHTDWCNIKNNGEVAICQRVPSNRPAKGGGWVHILKYSPRPAGGGSFRSARPDWEVLKQPHDAEKDFAALHASYWADLGFLRDCAAQLGVTEQSLRDLDVRYRTIGKCISIPMYSAEGKVIGLRYRTISKGRKYAEKGSHNGLFMPKSLCGSSDAVEELYVAEGATDTLAGLSAGLPVVGRCSCQTGTDELVELLRRLHVKRVTIIGDNDQAGRQGAWRLRDELDIPARVVFPPVAFKDLREWYQSRLLRNRADFDAVASCAFYRLHGQIDRELSPVRQNGGENRFADA